MIDVYNEITDYPLTSIYGMYIPEQSSFLINFHRGSFIERLISDGRNYGETIPLLVKVIEDKRNYPLGVSDDVVGILYKIYLLMEDDNPLKSSSLLEVILYNAAELSPRKTLELLYEMPLFNKIYEDPRIASSYQPPTRDSIAIAVYRNVRNAYGENPTDAQISAAIDDILSKRNSFSNKIILGKDTRLIAIKHEDDFMKMDPIRQFLINRGSEIFPYYFSGPSSKGDIIRTILYENKGETVIWVNAHGLPEYICLGGGVPNQDIGPSIYWSCIGFRYDEFSDILLERGNLREVTLIIDSCFSYNFAEQLINYLRKKKSSSFPTIITETNNGRYGYMREFIESLNQLNLRENEPLLGRHIYEAEAFSSDVQDSAVFFSEDGISPPREIAMNSLNQENCGICNGDSCPIESIQGTAS